MPKRKKHPNKAIEAAICSAEKLDWKFKASGNSSHAWGRLLCPWHKKENCAMSLWSTPRNPENHAKQILRKVKGCDIDRGNQS